MTNLKNKNLFVISIFIMIIGFVLVNLSVKEYNIIPANESMDTVKFTLLLEYEIIKHILIGIGVFLIGLVTFGISLIKEF